MERDTSSIHMVLCETYANQIQVYRPVQTETNLRNTIHERNRIVRKPRPYLIQHWAKFTIMDNLRMVLERQGYESDVKLLAFAAAAYSDQYRITFVPVPSVSMGDELFDIYGLRHLISMWPSCNQMLKRLKRVDRFIRMIEEGTGYTQLLFWMLVWQEFPKLQRVYRRQLSRLYRKFDLRQLSCRPTVILRVGYKRDRDLSRSSDRYVYFCCPLHYLYRLLIMRDIPDQIKIHDHPEAALAECPVPSCSGWAHSRFGHSPRCLIICELMTDEQPLLENEIPTPPDVYDQSCMNLRYLLIFGEYDRYAMVKANDQSSVLVRLFRWFKEQAQMLVYGN